MRIDMRVPADVKRGRKVRDVFVDDDSVFAYGVMMADDVEGVVLFAPRLPHHYVAHPIPPGATRVDRLDKLTQFERRGRVRMVLCCDKEKTDAI